jgi:hypothetical protein
MPIPTPRRAARRLIAFLAAACLAACTQPPPPAAPPQVAVTHHRPPRAPVQEHTDPEFELNYLYTLNFDRCGDRPTGQALRNLMQTYYRVCLARPSGGYRPLYHLQYRVIVIDKAIAKNDTDTIDKFLNSMNWAGTCPHFLSEFDAGNMQEAASESEAGSFHFHFPAQCHDNYTWLMG